MKSGNAETRFWEIFTIEPFLKLVIADGSIETLNSDQPDELLPPMERSGRLGIRSPDLPDIFRIISLTKLESFDPSDSRRFT